MSAKKTVELFYDVLSPYSWLGFEVLTRYQTKWNINLKLKPFFIAGIMQGSDNSPPGLVPKKFNYMGKDLSRLARYMNVPMKMPQNVAEVLFQKGSLPTQRFITAVDMMDSKYTEELSRQFWLRVWSKDEDIIAPESLIIAAKQAGVSEAVINDAMNKMKDESVKSRLKQYTQEALDHGAFGAPTIVAHVDGKEKMFFGSDRFEIIAQALGEKYEGPLPELSKCKL